MKTSRLKSTIIVILALLNACLLVLLVSRRLQEREARARSVAQLVALFAGRGVTLDPARVPEDELLPAPLDPARSPDEEAAFAAALLGPCEMEDVGGGICRYVGAHGQCLFRSSGALEAAPGLVVDDVAAYCDALFSAFGCTALSSELSGGSGTVRAVRALSGAPVFNAQLTLEFENGVLRSAAGFFVPRAEVREQVDGVDAVTALVRFLDYSAESGEVCTAVTSVSRGYLLQSTASAPQHLAPAWCVVTDVSQYYVNIATGEVSRET